MSERVANRQAHGIDPRAEQPRTAVGGADAPRDGTDGARAGGFARRRRWTG